MGKQIYKSILAGVDGSGQTNLVYERAIKVTRRNGSRIIVTNILENQVYTMMGYLTSSGQLINQETAAMEELMVDCKKYVESVDFHSVETVTISGSSKEVISHELPEKRNADLTMVGQSGLSAVERVVMGSISGYIICQAPYDILIVHSEER